MRDNLTGQTAATRLTSHLSNLTVAIALLATLVSGEARQSRQLVNLFEVAYSCDKCAKQWTLNSIHSRQHTAHNDFQLDR